MSFLEARFAPRNFLRDRQSVRQWLGVGVSSALEEFIHFSLDPLSGPLVTDGLVLARIRQHFGAIDADCADFEHFHFFGQQEHGAESAFDEGPVIAAKSADSVVIGMQVRSEIAHAHIVVGGGFKFP